MKHAIGEPNFSVPDNLGLVSEDTFVEIRDLLQASDRTTDTIVWFPGQSKTGLHAAVGKISRQLCNYVGDTMNERMIHAEYNFEIGDRRRAPRWHMDFRDHGLARFSAANLSPTETVVSDGSVDITKFALSVIGGRNKAGVDRVVNRGIRRGGLRILTPPDRQLTRIDEHLHRTPPYVDPLRVWFRTALHW
jgi:hypothetical protein